MLFGRRTSRGATNSFSWSSCIYPKFAPQPIPESALLSGPLEPTNETVRDCQDRRDQICQAYGVRVRRKFHLGHADKSLRARVIISILSPRMCWPRFSAKHTRRKSSGAGEMVVWGTASRGANFCMWTIWRTPVCSSSRNTIRRKLSMLAAAKTFHSGIG